MFDKIRQSKLMYWSLELLILATLVFVSTKIGFLFSPIATFFSTLFMPVIIAGFLFYLLNPLVKFLEKRAKISRNIAIVLVFVVLVLGVVLMVGAVIPNLVEQVAQLVQNLPSFIKSVEAWINEVIQHPLLKEIDINTYIDKLDLSFGQLIQKFVSGLSSSVGSIVSGIANAAVVVVTVPFILFYMLKDGSKIRPAIAKIVPKNRGKEAMELLGKMSDTISSYISGQAIECLFVATFTFLGYLIIGVDYAFLFGCIAGATNMIPYLGPYLGLAPAVLVTVFDSPFKALLACLVVLVVQQVDGNIIYPNVIGRSLDIHPLTIIFILLVAGNISGLLGMVLGVPFYAVCRTIIVYIYNIVRLNRKDDSTGSGDESAEVAVAETPEASQE